MGGGLGAEIELQQAPGMEGLDSDIALFSESNGRFVITVARNDCERLEALLDPLPAQRIGEVTRDTRLVVRRDEKTLVDVEVSRLRKSFKRGLENV
jgi:phosphoribosylformylglycinamidine synthase